MRMNLTPDRTGVTRAAGTTKTPKQIRDLNYASADQTPETAGGPWYFLVFRLIDIEYRRWAVAGLVLSLRARKCPPAAA